MRTYTRRLAVAIAAATLLFGCKKNFDEFYAPPPDLDPPIYQQLEAMGKFTQFLSLIDKAGYKPTLAAAGYWTMFAPTDSAFQNDTEFAAYLQSRNIANLAAIDSATAQSIVQYLLVFNGFEKDRLDDFQSNLGWVVDNSFKRRTAYYTGFYKDTTAAGQIVTAVASNRNNTGGVNSYYNPADNNNKYINFFTSNYFATKGLNATDYNYFYPNTPYTGFNVANAKVTQQDIAAENGVIHVLDHVVTPQMSLDQYLRTKPEFSEFKNLFNRYMVQFLPNVDATRRYQVLTGNSDNVLVKVYSNLLAFSLNNENYLKLQDNDGQRDSWTLFAPKNDSLLDYLGKILKEGYGSVNALPLNIIADLLNSHMWQTAVWPSKFNSTFNFLGEPAYLDKNTDVVDKKVLSNGIFYGTSKVNEPNVFSTVYGKAYLNPKFGIMTRLLNMELRTIITNPGVKYTIFMMPDAVLNAQGYNFNLAANAWTLGTTANDSNRLNLLRILNTGVIETPNNELAGLGTPGFSGIIGSYGGEYIKFNGNQIITAGTRERGITATIDSIKNTKNGRVVYLNNLLYFPYAPIGKDIERLGTPTTSEYNLFWNYLRNSTAYDPTTSTIVGTSPGSFYTILAPRNNAIRQAITDGLLPGTAATPNFNPTLTADKVKVEKFIQYHILDKRSIIADGRDQGSFLTLLKNAAGDPVTISVLYPGGVLEFGDGFGRKARLINALSNELSNRTTIHLLDNYLKY
ncbi:MAG: fasciclin domain-containing protein [Chitinophagaceae bacterium]|nr:fasciclin domain-containing protein [Chitinophagaceae bacterium]